MTRKAARRTTPVLDDLEERHLQSGLAASPQAASSAYILPYLEQENLRPANPGRVPGGGGESQIIAILIG